MVQFSRVVFLVIASLLLAACSQSPGESEARQALQAELESAHLAELLKVNHVEKLNGYEDIPATLVLEDVTDSNGNFNLQALPGVYRAEFMPGDANEPTGDLATLVIIDTSESNPNLNFGTITMASLVDTEAEVVDGDGPGASEWVPFASQSVAVRACRAVATQACAAFGSAGAALYLCGTTSSTSAVSADAAVGVGLLRTPTWAR